MDDPLDTALNKLKSILGMASGSGGAPTPGTGLPTPPSYTPASYGPFSPGAPGPFTSGTPGPFTPLPASNNTRFVTAYGTGTNAFNYLGQAAIGTAKAAFDLAGFLPSTEESLTTESMAARMGFYHAGKSTRYGQYSIMNAAMAQGTPMTPGDILSAVNMAQGAGLGAGLPNFAAGANTNAGRFSGVLGGAALASNLVPGIGLTGGVGVVANLNRAQNVNMMRMLGIQGRATGGTGPQDLPNIIEQIYNRLSAADPNFTSEDLAVSLMSGNALDSFLNQITGGDVDTRSAIIAGLVQRIKTGKGLRISGTTAALGETGGTINAITSTGLRNAREQQLIEKYSNVTNKALVGTNNALQALYGGLSGGDAATPPGLATLQQTATALTTFAGARGGAGGLMLYDMMQGIGGAGKYLSKYVPGLSALSKANSKKGINPLGALSVFGLAATVGTSGDQPTGLTDSPFSTTPATSAPSAIGPTFTGGITINVSAPPGADPYAYSAAFLDAFK